MAQNALREILNEIKVQMIKIRPSERVTQNISMNFLNLIPACSLERIIGNDTPKDVFITIRFLSNWYQEKKLIHSFIRTF